MAATITKSERNYLEEWAKRQIEADERRNKKLDATRKRIAERREELNRCLDPVYAAQVEAAKPRYDYEVSCMLTERVSGKRIQKTPTERVTAQNENEAWAIFCDTIKSWPSPHSCNRVIKKLT